MTLEERWQGYLDAIKSHGRYRTLRTPQGVDFSSNDYLGYGKLAWQCERERRARGLRSRWLCRAPLQGQRPCRADVLGR